MIAYSILFAGDKINRLQKFLLSHLVILDDEQRAAVAVLFALGEVGAPQREAEHVEEEHDGDQVQVDEKSVLLEKLLEIGKDDELREDEGHVHGDKDGSV